MSLRNFGIKALEGALGLYENPYNPIVDTIDGKQALEVVPSIYRFEQTNPYRPGVSGGSIRVVESDESGRQLPREQGVEVIVQTLSTSVGVFQDGP